MVERYKCVVSNVQATAHAAAHPDGEYVKWEEYERLRGLLREACACHNRHCICVACEEVRAALPQDAAHD